MNPFTKNNNSSSFSENKIKKYVDDDGGIYSGFLIDMYWQIVNPAIVVFEISEKFEDTIKVEIKTANDLNDTYAQIIYKEGGAKFVEIKEKEKDNYYINIPALDSACIVKLAFTEKDIKKVKEIDEIPFNIVHPYGKETIIPKANKILRPLFAVDGVYKFDIFYTVNADKDKYWEKYIVKSCKEGSYTAIEKSLLNRLAFVIPYFNKDKIQKRVFDIKEETVDAIWYNEQERFLNQFYNFINYFTDFDDSFRAEILKNMLKDEPNNPFLVTIDNDNIQNFGILLKWDTQNKKYIASISSDGNLIYKNKIGDKVLNLFNPDFWYKLYEESIKFIKGIKDIQKKRIEICTVFSLVMNKDNNTGKYKENLYVQFPKRSQIFRSPEYYNLGKGIIGLKTKENFIKPINFYSNLLISLGIPIEFDEKKYDPAKYEFTLSKEEQTLLAMAQRLKSTTNDTKKDKKVYEPVVANSNNNGTVNNNEDLFDDDLPF